MSYRRNVGRLLVLSAALAGANVLVAQGPGGGGGGQRQGGGGQRQGGGQQGGGGQRPGGGGQQGGGQYQGGGSSQRPQGQYQGGGQSNGGNRYSGGGQRPGGGQGGGRPAQWGQSPQNRQSYNFRSGDRDYLRRYYSRNLGYINMGNRPRFSIGGFFPWAYINYITPVPPPVYSYLPPPPPGYDMGYYQGYVVVYDPVTYFIANVIDLVTQ